MQVEIAYSEFPDTATNAVAMARAAKSKARRTAPADFALVFYTAQHSAEKLRAALSEEIGYVVPIFGGPAVGVISNDYFGYAGNQAILALVWLDGADMRFAVADRLIDDEILCGKKLARKFREFEVSPSSPLMLFYNAIDRRFAAPRLLSAHQLLCGIREELGFYPDITGVGMMGDYICSSVAQQLGDKTGDFCVEALIPGGEMRIDHTIVHGCRPSTRYLTVTKSDGPAILEIENQPALKFISQILGPSVSPNDLPLSLILGMNNGEPWMEFREANYANRLVLAVDPSRDALIMFEPGMDAGTRFQIMYSRVELSYIAPRIEQLFAHLAARQRTPVLAVYINCAGRAAGYGGIDLEDAPVVQAAVANRVPLLGIYGGVEIARVDDTPHVLDYTGVFCLFSLPTNSPA